MAEPTESLMELVLSVDSVPLDYDFNQLYRLVLPSDPRPHGFLHPNNVSRIPWTPSFTVDHQSRTVSLSKPVVSAVESSATPGKVVTAALQAVVDAALQGGMFPQLVPGVHSEQYQIMGTRLEPDVRLERYPSPLFGIAGRGAHMTAYVRGSSGRAGDMRIWVARRNRKIHTYPGKLDSSVAGGVKADDSPLECIVAESDEEASLDRDWVRERARAVGALTYMGHNKKNETMQPVVLYVYDLECPPDVLLKPRDEEVEEFILMSVEEVMCAMKRHEFKPNVCLVMIDFFIRQGIITQESEPDYLELQARLRRKLPVPVAPRVW